MKGGKGGREEGDVPALQVAVEGAANAVVARREAARRVKRLVNILQFGLKLK
jgi:hypothetical protein